MNQKSAKIALYGSLIVALAGTLGSLFFSEVLKFAPCVLCWWQRIALYPLVAIFTVGILRKDTKVYLYALPLSIFGAAIALYQNLLYYHVIPESLAPCTLGVSCITRYIEWFGFISIPLLSFISFLLITAAMIWFRKLTMNKDI